jgi:hypothetical protein
MMSDRLQIYLSLSNGMAALWMLADLGGFWVCVSHRRLSSRLLVAASGFVGLFASAAIGRLASLSDGSTVELIYLASILASALGCLSTVVLVFGLGAALVDLRRQLAIALDPPHARH